MELLSYWSDSRLGHQLPKRNAIDPVDIPRLLPHLVLTEVTNENRLRYRLVGTAIEDVAGMGLTGQFVEDVVPHKPYCDYLVGLYRQVLTKRCPVFSESDFVSSQFEPVRATQRLMLPLSSDGKNIDLIMSGQVFIDRDSEAPLPNKDEPFNGRVILALPGN
ncbi:MAG: PAS domain-containing protein [Pseudomonadota bacterium]